MYDYKIKKQNRINKKKAKKTSFWCSACDAQLIGQHGKCPNCGSRENRSKNKDF